ncbi:flagellar basal body P-ring formation chaperone FlgA [Undibacterium terreum]|uniref:Flagella basal body P-ring formation protein FlgA n=1 Tax=Undibacterium terreum TaxID=1224302 RepID=A0A916UWT5_9BURK|nr:flagellar basal body P-ring formation chaperone FlgA [Undibacterium terreum]GGC92329.1 flagella basal body P-ring formation protein FlgA [Undibacterium terreum]
MKKLGALMLMAFCQFGWAQATAPVQYQDQATVRAAAEEFLKIQAQGQPGEVNITLGPIDSRLKLATCDNLAPFLPKGSKPWGKISVGVRCTTPTAWLVYMTANVRVSGDYYVAANSISQGQTLTLTDLAKVKGELSNLPAGVITSPEQAIGRTMTMSIASGTLLRMDNLRNIPVIQQGQSVRVTSKGSGFQVSTDALALNNAAEGQIVKARTLSGQVLSGIAKAGGQIEVTY